VNKLQATDYLRIIVDRRARVELLTPSACARILGYSESRVLQLIRSGRIEARRVGRQFLVLDEVLEKFVDNQRRKLEKLTYEAPDR
jgi:excisionase family DNA binding protein